VIGVLGTLGIPGLLSASCRDGECCAQFNEEIAAPFPAGVRLTSVYSRSAGIVRWRACLDEYAEQVEVDSSHIGMSVSAPAYRAIAAGLARPAAV